MNLVTPINGRVSVTQTEGPSALAPEASSIRLHTPRASVRAGDDSLPITEKPEHRLMAQMLAMGMSQTEVARSHNVEKGTISCLLKTPWFQEMVTKFMREGTSDVMSLLRGAAMDAVVTLIELVDSPKTPAAVRLAGVKEILERNLGKSVQHLEVKSAASSDPVAEVEALEKELASRRDEIPGTGCAATDSAG